MSFLAFPLELLDSVAQFLHTSDLATLATLNSTFYHIAQRRLYRHVSVYSPSKFPVILALANTPRLAHYVKSFHITLDHCTPLLQSFYRVLANALSNMSQLVSLDVYLNPEASWIMRTRDGTTWHNLRRFSSSFHLDHHVAHFLNKAHTLLDLQIGSMHLHPSASPILHPNALPHLSEFAGSSQVAQFIIPGRPVECIHLHSGDLTEDVAESLAKSTAPIQVLMAATSSHSVSLLGTLTRFMEKLVHLRIVSTYNFVDAPDTSYFTNIANALTLLPDLISCEIWGMHWVSSKNTFDDEARIWQSETFTESLPEGSALDEFYSEFYYA